MEGARKVSGLDEPITYSGQRSARSQGGRSGERRQALNAASYHDCTISLIIVSPSMAGTVKRTERSMSSRQRWTR